VSKPVLKRAQQEGFVLPYVLLVIAMLAIASALTAQYFIKTSIPDDFLTEERDLSQNDIWLLGNELRIAPTEQGRVFVKVDDLSGIISLNVAPKEYITKLLVYLDVPEQEIIDCEVCRRLRTLR